MERPTTLVLLSLAAVLVLLPLTLDKPGWPAGVKADEPAYFMMALSLAHDFDLRVDTGDLQRLFDSFPHHVVRNVILMTDDGWHTVYFGKPYVYSLLAAPLARFFGANGLVATNMALLVLMIALGTRYLGRFNPDGLALLFSAGFFILSVGFAYAFWMQPEVFNMASVTVSLYLGLTDGGRRGLLSRPNVRLLLAGAALMPAVYNKPMLAAMGLPVFVRVVRQAWPDPRARWRSPLIYIGGGVVALALLVGGSVALTGHASAYLGVARAGVKVCTADEMPVQPLPPPPPAAQATVEKSTSEPLDKKPERGSMADTRRASWFWIFRLPSFDAGIAAEHLGYFLWGRHTGLFLYFPFTLLTLFVVVVDRRRREDRAESWALLAALVIVAVFFLFWIPFNWHGGGGFVGNRYYVNVYPGFLFLVRRIRPPAATVAGYVLGGLLLGPTVFTPMGRAVPEPTLQAHVRNFPFPLFPLELGVKGIPGYHDARLSGVRFQGRKDVFLPRGPAFWARGATSAEIWLTSGEPLEGALHFTVEMPVDNDVTLRLGDSTEHHRLAAGERRRLSLEPGPPRVRRVRRGDGTVGEVYHYRLDVKTRTGRVAEWTQHYPPRECEEFPWAPTTVESFYLGAEISFLGTTERLERDVYAVRWARAEAPDTSLGREIQVEAGQAFTVDVALRNRSAATWPSDPPVQVNLSYHWQDAAGNMDTGKTGTGGLRTYLAEDVPPNGFTEAEMTVEAPDEPGDYVLVLDLVYEQVAWFSDRGAPVKRLPVRVLPSSGGAAATKEVTDEGAGGI